MRRADCLKEAPVTEARFFRWKVICLNRSENIGTDIL